MKNLIITIDGPSASGKGTLAKNLSQHLHLFWIDTGLLYRAVAFQLLSEHKNPSPENATSIASQLTIPVLPSPELRTPEVTALTSKIATLSSVRNALLPLQQNLAHNPPPPYKGTVLDGRDTGSVVCPHAHAKFYLDASLAQRTERRFLEQKNYHHLSKQQVEDALQKRDQQDSQRELAPLTVPHNAISIDSSSLSPEDTLKICLETLTQMGMIPS